MKLLPPTVLLIITGIFLSSCKSTYFFRSNYNSANQLLHSTSNSISKPFLKAHMQNGDVLILKDSWEIDTIQNSVLGSGDQYNYKRRLVYSGEIEISIDSVALFETNSKLIKPEEGRIAGLAIMGGLDVILSIICATVPKACWGSCPTFYLEPNENVHYAEAEGFSNAVLPSMEYGDYDDLGVINPGHTKVLDLIMKNEALETHSVNKLKLFTFPLKANERVIISSDNAFYTTNGRYKVQSATAEEGDILKLIQSAGKFERTSLADEQNLATKEEIILTYEDVDFSKTLGLSLTFRQTLMSTYLIYTGIDYMGYSMGDIVADIERQQNMDDILKTGVIGKLGAIDIYLWQGCEWVYQGDFHETGPIALNKQLVILDGVESDSIKIKIELNKGYWRIDEAFLTTIIGPAEPIILEPKQIAYQGKLQPRELQYLYDDEGYVISFPGDIRTIQFEFESEELHEVFLYSKGYYLEWMRQEWSEERNLFKLNQMLNHPEAYLKDEAASYKAYEQVMERYFWDSRVTKTYSHE